MLDASEATPGIDCCAILPPYDCRMTRCLECGHQFENLAEATVLQSVLWGNVYTITGSDDVPWCTYCPGDPQSRYFAKAAGRITSPPTRSRNRNPTRPWSA